MIRRQAISVLALLGALDSAYLLLHKLGAIGDLACVAGGSCDIVNTSAYSSLFGMPVAAYGLAGYLTIFGLALFATRPSRSRDTRLPLALAALGAIGSAFSIYLTYVSLALIGAACPWCLVSLGLILSITVLAVIDVVAGPADVPRPRTGEG